MHIKRYLVTSSCNYYPCSGVDDWDKSYDDLDKAKKRAKELIKNKPGEKDYSYVIDLSNLSEVAWYHKDHDNDD